MPTRERIGTSVNGHPIYAYATGDTDGRAVLVVGCIHGDEPAGVAIARELMTLRPPAGVRLWLIPVLNPDGIAAGSRGNAHGVDLNRNFPYGWRDLDSPAFNSGTRALSEPESRAAYRFVLRIHPLLSIWFHQHLGVVDDSQGWRVIERAFARLVGLRAVPLADHAGSATSWENHQFPGTTAFVTELHAGELTPAQTARYARAVLTIAKRVTKPRP